MAKKKHVVTGRPKLTPRRAKRFRLKPIARQLRAEGYSYNEIGMHLGVTAMTAWNWSHDVPQGDVFANC